MPWTYSKDPNQSSRDGVRFLLGDTDENDPQLSDAEIVFLLDQQGQDIYLAASLGAQGLAAKYGRLVDRSVGDLKISYSQRQKNYMELADALLASAASGGT